MSSQSDLWRSEQAVRRRKIKPFKHMQEPASVPSSELLSSGYDLHASDKVRILVNVDSVPVGARAFDARMFVRMRNVAMIGPPHVPLLGRFSQCFRIPGNVLSICVEFSTCAHCEIRSERNAIRAGVGKIRNTGNLQHDVAIGHGRCQREAVPDSVFPLSGEVCAVNYAGRKGKLREQQGSFDAKAFAFF
jgi:hypothetical protein